MPSKYPRKLIDDMAIALALGGSLPRWAAEHSVPERTARDWTRTPTYAEVFQRTRAELIDRTIGIQTRAILPVNSQMIRLALKSADENIRLRACQAVSSNFLALASFAEQARQLAQLRADIAALKAGGASS